jgi:hypothetical protein
MKSMEVIIIIIIVIIVIIIHIDCVCSDTPIIELLIYIIVITS